MTIPVEPIAVPLTATPEGGVRIGTSRVSLDSVLYHFNQGASAEDIVSGFPTLKLGDVYAVIGYYLAHQSAVDEYLASRRQHAEALRARVDAPTDKVDLRARLLARQAATHVPAGAHP